MNLPGAPDEVLTIPTAHDASVTARFAMHEPVVGYRAWLVRPGCDGYRLRGMMVPPRGAAGPGAWTCAVCRPQDGGGSIHHDELMVSHSDCACGLHAYHSLSTGGYDAAWSCRTALALGSCGARWSEPAGCWRIATAGERSSRAQWRSCSGRPRRTTCRGLASQLGVAAVRSNDIARVAAEFGRPWRTTPLGSPTRVAWTSEGGTDE